MLFLRICIWIKDVFHCADLGFISLALVIASACLTTAPRRHRQTNPASRAARICAHGARVARRTLRVFDGGVTVPLLGLARASKMRWTSDDVRIEHRALSRLVPSRLAPRRTALHRVVLIARQFR